MQSALVLCYQMKMTDLFYIKTKDGTDIAVFDLVIDGREITFSYNTVEDSIESEPYENEVQAILSKLMTEQMQNEGG